MFPIRDQNPTLRPPVMTIALIVANVLVWALLQRLGTWPGIAESMCHWALIPGDLLGSADPGTVVPLGRGLGCVLDGNGSPLTVFTSMFMHGGWLHIVFNMWFLWVFGDNVEDVMGRARFLVFYLLCGVAAAAAQVVSAPDGTTPMVGASGAIGGVMGAYALLYPRAPVQLLIFLGFFVTTVHVPAVLMLGYWFLLQVLSGVPALGRDVGGVAFWAHVGGFLAGLALAGLLVDRRRLEARRRLRVRV